jgi:hypothetical protein
MLVQGLHPCSRILVTSTLYNGKHPQLLVFLASRRPSSSVASLRPNNSPLCTIKKEGSSSQSYMYHSDIVAPSRQAPVSYWSRSYSSSVPSLPSSYPLLTVSQQTLMSEHYRGLVGNGDDVHAGDKKAKEAAAKAFLHDIDVGKLSIMPLAVDGEWSRVLEAALQSSSKTVRRGIVSELVKEKGRVLALTNHIFGSYIIRRALDVDDERLRAKVIAELVGNMWRCGSDKFGTHVIQKALDVGSDELKRELISELEGNVMSCVNSMYATHVLQKALDACPDDEVKEALLSELKGNVLYCSLRALASPVIEKAFRIGSRRIRDTLALELKGNVLKCAFDKYGVYVISTVIMKLKNESIRQPLICELQGQLYKLYRGNKGKGRMVVEVLLQAADTVTMKRLEGELLRMIRSAEKRGHPNGGGDEDNKDPITNLRQHANAWN